MIKKLFLCAALVGAVGLTSCVDDVESASVVAVREGKAAEIKAAANLQKANAQAEAIMAAAAQAAQQGQAALDQANIEYNQAQAALERAEAAYQMALAAQTQAESESEQAAAAVELEKARVALEVELQKVEEFKIAVEAQKAKLAADLADYEAQIAQYLYQATQRKDALDQLIAGKADKEYERLKKLVKEYNDQSKTLLDLQKRMFTQQKLLAEFEAGITSNVAVAQKQIQEKDAENNELANKIAAGEAYIATLKTGDYAKALENLPILEAKAETLAKDVEDATSNKTTADNAVTSAKNKLENSDYVDAIKLLKGESLSFKNSYKSLTYNLMSGGFTQGYTQWGSSASYGVPYLKITLTLNDGSDKTIDPSLYNMYYLTIKSKDLNNPVKTETIAFFSNNDPAETETLKQTVTHQRDPWVSSGLIETVYTVDYEVYNPDKYYTLVAGSAEKFKTIISDNIKNLNDTVDTYQTEIDEAKATLDGLEAANKVYEDAVEAQANPAEGADADALAAAVADAKAKVEELLKKIDKDYTYDADYNNVVNNLNSTIRNKTSYKNEILNYYLPEIEKFAKEINACLAALGDGSAIPALVKDYNGTLQAQANAEMAENVANGAKDVNDAEIRACEGIINGTLTEDGKTLDQVISEKQTEIDGWNNEIEANNTAIDDLKAQLEGNKIKDDELIAKIKAEIDALSSEIAYQQKVVDAAKAALDAALAEDAPAEK